MIANSPDGSQFVSYEQKVRKPNKLPPNPPLPPRTIVQPLSPLPHQSCHDSQYFTNSRPSSELYGSIQQNLQCINQSRIHCTPHSDRRFETCSNACCCCHLSNACSKMSISRLDSYTSNSQIDCPSCHCSAFRPRHNYAQIVRPAPSEPGPCTYTSMSERIYHPMYQTSDCRQRPYITMAHSVCNGDNMNNNEFYLDRCEHNMIPYQTNSLSRTFNRQPDSYQHHHLQQQPPLPSRAPPLPPLPTPKRRPRLSASPLPELKKSTKLNSNTAKTYQKCKSLHYRRFMEQHLERIFKYLQEREKRREKCVQALQQSPLGDDEGTILTLFNRKETMYLRSLRAKLNKNDFEMIVLIGQGYFGKVHLVRKIDREKCLEQSEDSPASNLYAMKILDKSRVFEEKQTAHVIAERDILAEAHNEWIVKLFYSFQDNDFLYFIMEYIPCGDILTLLQHKNVFSQEWASFYTAEISLAVQFVHDMGFIHRDIKPDNILIDRNGHIKLTDFGLCTGFRWTHDSSYYVDETINSKGERMGSFRQNISREDHPTLTKALELRHIEHKNVNSRRRNMSLVGTANYVAPEIPLLQNYSQLCDWWSVGVILYEMIVGYCPFAYDPKLDVLDPRQNPQDFEQIKYRIIHWRDFLGFPSNDKLSPDTDGYYHKISDEAKDLICGFLCDQEHRLCKNGIDDIKSHKFFAGIDWRQIRQTAAPYKPQLDNDLDTRHFPLNDGHTVGRKPANSSNNQYPINDFTFKFFPLDKMN